MERLSPGFDSDRRHLADWRAHATRLWSTLRWRGRRRGFRRAGEGYKTYLVGVLLTGSLLDAYLTIRYVQQGGGEANPLMAWALLQGYPVFISLKMGLTGIGAWFLAAHQQFPLAYTGLQGLTLAYLVLCMSYMVFFVC